LIGFEIWLAHCLFFQDFLLSPSSVSSLFISIFPQFRSHYPPVGLTCLPRTPHRNFPSRVPFPFMPSFPLPDLNFLRCAPLLIAFSYSTPRNVYSFRQFMWLALLSVPSIRDVHSRLWDSPDIFCFSLRVLTSVNPNKSCPIRSG